MIPEAAVEAAWDAFYASRESMEAALEAAAPHMLVQADPVVVQILKSTRWA